LSNLIIFNKRHKNFTNLLGTSSFGVCSTQHRNTQHDGSTCETHHDGIQYNIVLRTSFSVMLNLVIMSVIMLNAILPNVVMLNFIMLNVVMLNVIMQKVVIMTLSITIDKMRHSA
jgi:hypothetical protein